MRKQDGEGQVVYKELDDAVMMMFDPHQVLRTAQ
jgi:hypothetical protein